ncbi:DUF6158 family protein [Antrihabitans cavernicola]|uniref:Uncharacterized protein n=1 Tax=Antrihabitans cavernicola TaxID=2495913 RepID=A0A5A7S8D1_9NOCA|nr:DUF6158 family protein [Spelaeibacter cavernicola]KAA0020036.1 hypothetical protein FOY51_21990 [Spelaeibacter cavernicola]
MTTTGRPVSELSDEELESQGKQAHETRNWVFLHGTAEQFANHTTRMLALEQEYLLRYPKRTWQGSGGAPSAPAEGDNPGEEPTIALLRRLADQPDGRMHKLELHQVARECGVPRERLAALYNSDPPMITADRADRVITEHGRAAVSNAD